MTAAETTDAFDQLRALARGAYVAAETNSLFYNFEGAMKWLVGLEPFWNYYGWNDSGPRDLLKRGMPGDEEWIAKARYF